MEQRDLGFMADETKAQIEGLIDVEGEVAQLPCGCAVCRLTALEAFTESLLSFAADASPPPAEHTGTGLCGRCESRGLFGALERRRRTLRQLCDELLAGPQSTAAFTPSFCST